MTTDLRTTRRVLAAAAALGLGLAACGGDADPAAEESTEASASATSAAPSSEGDASTSPSGSEAADGALLTGACSSVLTTPDVLTVATGDPVFSPWMEDDDPTNGRGFESALVYELADALGVPEVEWVRTGFDEAIAPGDKPYDLNVQQYSITPERDEAVDFSTGYYAVEQAIIGAPDSPVADATTLADLADDRLGAAVGTTSLDYVDQVIEPDEPAQVFDDNAASKAAFDAGQVDGIVYDLPTAYYITAVEIPDAAIIGVLPRLEDEPEELGMLFEEGSELVGCVDAGLAQLEEDGTLEALEDEWLNQGGDIPSIEQ